MRFEYYLFFFLNLVGCFCFGFGFFFIRKCECHFQFSVWLQGFTSISQQEICLDSNQCRL